MGNTANDQICEDRIQKAVAMRLERHSYQAIADALGYANESGARHAVSRVLAERRKLTAESAEEIRQLDVAKLDELEQRMTALVRDPETLPNEKVAASRAAVHALERRAVLLGLDAALRVEATVTVDPKIEVEALIGKILAAKTSGA